MAEIKHPAARATAGPVSHEPPPYRPPVPVHHPSPSARRTAVEQARTAGTQPTTHPAVWQPWVALAKQAEARYKTEITAALRDYESAAALAGQVIDTASAMAAEVSGQLEAIAWQAWHKYMAAADQSSRSILDPARAGYDQAIAYAREAYDRALGDAEKTYKAVLADVARAKADGQAANTAA